MVRLHSYTACIAFDASCWVLLFLWVGAPLTTKAHSFWYTTALTLTLALLVALTWPVRPRLHARTYTSGFMRWSDAILASVVADKAREDTDASAEPLVKASLSHNFADAERVTTAEFYACFVLCAALLLGGLCSQLDWNILYQQWPYPHLLLYSVVRVLVAVVQSLVGLLSSKGREDGTRAADRATKKEA